MNKHGILTVYVPVGDRNKVERFKELAAIRQTSVSVLVLDFIDDYVKDADKIRKLGSWSQEIPFFTM